MSLWWVCLFLLPEVTLFLLNAGSASTVMPTPARTATTKTLTRVEVPEPWEQNSQSSLFVLPLASLRHDRFVSEKTVIPYDTQDIPPLLRRVDLHQRIFNTTNFHGKCVNQYNTRWLQKLVSNARYVFYKTVILLTLEVTPKTAFAYASLSLGALLMEDKDRSYSLVNSAKKILDALGPNNSFVASCT